MTVQPVHPEDTNPNLRFLEEVSFKTAGVARLEMCIQCGTCGGSCPSAADMDHTPRMLFAMIRAGMREDSAQVNTPWMCVSCYYCVVRCPQEVHITDVMYTLKSMAIQAKLYRDSTAPDFSHDLRRYGRELRAQLRVRAGLAALPQALPPAPAGHGADGLGMLSKKRMSMTPKRIKGIDQLKTILERAKELEVAMTNYLLYPGCSMESSAKAYAHVAGRA